MAISERDAWRLARDFAKGLANELRAVIVIGSLAAGAYRIGTSDIDTVVIVKSRNAYLEGNVRRMADEFQVRHGLPSHTHALRWRTVQGGL